MSANGEQKPTLAKRVACQFVVSYDKIPKDDRGKITFGDMRESGVRGVLIYCA